MLTLSICIPSYNRFEQLRLTVKNILKSNSQDFEIVIVDNCSPRNIYDYIHEKDPRLRIVKRITPVYGAQNVLDCIFYGNGEYSMILLDKDSLEGKFLNDFIRCLKNWELAGGYCVLNSINTIAQVYKKNRILNFGFLSKHPSGNFYRMSILKTYVESHISILEKDPFSFDFCLAYCAYKGDMLYYDKSLVNSNLCNFSSSQTSLTFSKNKNNLFYHPSNIISEFKNYIENLNEFDLERNYRILVVCSLYKRNMKNITIGYRNIMKNIDICKHYHHKTENVSLIQMLLYAINLRNCFYEVDVRDLNLKDKFKIEFILFFTFIKKFIMKIIMKMV